MADLFAVLKWWLVLQAMGLVALPLVFRLLRWLPDRGYSVAKPAGLLLGNIVLWLLGYLGWLRNTEGGILLAFGVVAATGAWVYARWSDGVPLRDWLRAHRGWMLAYEAVFLAALVFWAVFRAHNPDLSTTEKPMEFAFMNAIARSTTIPPPDPWLSGFSISYYYFGYVMMSTLMKVSGVNPGVAFSLTNAMWFALTAAGAFGIVANLVAASKRATTTAIVATGLLGAVFVPLLGNFQGPLEVAHANAIGTPEFWRWLDIREVNTPPRPIAPGEVRWPYCDGCSHPRGVWWFWRASRVVHDYPIGSNRTNPNEYSELIDEFPFFSFFLGDNHPHVLALPYALLSIALAFNLFRMASSGGSSPDPPRDGWRQWFWADAPIAGMYPIFLGALGFLNTWDFPIHVFISALAWGAGRWMFSRRSRPPLPAESQPESPSAWSIWADALIALVACVALGALAYLPFYIGFRSQAGGLLPNVFWPTRLPQFFVMFGPFLLIGGALLVTLLARAVRRHGLRMRRVMYDALGGGAAIVAGAGLLTALATLAVLLVSGGARSKLDEWSGELARAGVSMGQAIVERLGEFGVPLLLGVAMAAIARILRARTGRTGGEASSGDEDGGLPFALMLFAVGALLAFAVEFVYLLDFFGTRMNTVFKFYYQAWALWGVASAYAAHYLLASSERLTHAVGRAAFAGVLTISLVGGLTYPLLALPSGTRLNYAGPPTLDARAPTMLFAADEVAAIEWLDRNAGERSVILEAEGQSYQEDTSRLAAWTGVSSVLGWVGHEGQWRGVYTDISPRQPDIDAIYTTTDPLTALSLLRKYGVDYVYVGPNEQAKYPPAGLAKFNALGDMVFQQGGSTLYRIRTLDGRLGGSPTSGFGR